ncbi:hypothetical protein JAAARDRAFT_50719 [Jaapia argillacea MUCL 33604]|uniref:DUF6699 domain-containing protein n=1 Tax=Jaapia argillacea MUCL 33604 TaxID=933084 RepID=A0A067P9M1_9AGAM|nr:hypothetical protein JAAARDRAFT_50719 [Jaapia argillacea MUCL 33604]
MSYSKTHSHSNSNSSVRSSSASSGGPSAAQSSPWSVSPPAPEAPGAPYIQPVPLPESPSPPARSLSNSPPETGESAATPVIHPALSFQLPLALLFNIIDPVSQIQYRLPLNPSSLDEQAIQPSATSLSIRMPQLPLWSFTVENPQGITVSDVLTRIQTKLSGRVSLTEWQGAFSKTAQDMGVVAFNARTSGNASARGDGVKRMDLLGPNIFFAGLVTPSDGSDHLDAYFVPRAFYELSCLSSFCLGIELIFQELRIAVEKRKQLQSQLSRGEWHSNAVLAGLYDETIRHRIVKGSLQSWYEVERMSTST